MQIEIRFENSQDGDQAWTALRLSRVLCDVQRFASLVQNMPIGGSQHLPHFEGFDAGYSTIVAADLSRSGALWRQKADAAISVIRMSGPLHLVFGMPDLASGSIALVKQMCKLMVDMQGTVAGLGAPRRGLIIKRMKSLSRYAALRDRLELEEDRGRLDAILLIGVEPLLDGRYPRIRKMGRLKLMEPGESVKGGKPAKARRGSESE